MMTRKVLLSSLILFAAACSREKKEAPAAVTSQPPAVVKVRANPTKAMVSMSDPAVDDYIVKDVSDTLEAKTWRWAYDRPELRFQVKQATGQKLEAHFAIADATFKTTGPVTITFLVSNKVLGTMKVNKPCEQVFSKAVPADLIKTDDFTDVAMEAKPFWTSPADGLHLSMILTQVGFTSADAAK